MRAVTKLTVHVNDMMSIELCRGNLLDLIICLSQCDKSLAASFHLCEAPVVNVLSVCTSHRFGAIAEAMRQQARDINLDKSRLESVVLVIPLFSRETRKAKHCFKTCGMWE